MASGLSSAVGFKNGTDGSLPNAMNGLLSAREAHAFLGIDADGVTSVVKTTGNPDGHLVLRGGRGKSNYHASDIASAAEYRQPADGTELRVAALFAELLGRDRKSPSRDGTKCIDVMRSARSNSVR